MELAGPYLNTNFMANEGPKTGDCIYDTFTVSNPGFSSPPIICGTNTGQHMFVPASDLCNTINIDIDTGTTSTTRKWQLKITQYECGSLRAPEQDCLQYLTAQMGTVATFNWDMSTTTIANTQAHLSNQYYDICFRRVREQCSICFSPEIRGAAAAATSYGLSSAADDAAKNVAGVDCTGITTQPADTGLGDYIEIPNLQPSIGSAGTLSKNARICGSIFAAIDSKTVTAAATACSFASPFRIGVHFDEGESLVDTEADKAAQKKGENILIANLIADQGFAYSGFWLAYWMNSCT